MQQIKNVSMAESRNGRCRVARLYTTEDGQCKVFEKTFKALNPADVPNQYIETVKDGVTLFVKNSVSVEYSGSTARWVLPTLYDQLISEHISLNDTEAKEQFA